MTVASSTSTVVGGVRSSDHQEKVAFSPDGRWLAAGFGADLRIWSVGEDLKLVNQSSLGEEQLTTLGFSADRLVVVAGTSVGVGSIRQFAAPDWAEGKRIGLGAIVPGLLRVHPTAARAATGLVGALSWNPRNPAEKGTGAVITDLQSGLPIGGAGPVSGSALCWVGDDMAAVDLGSLRRYTTASRQMTVLRPIPDSNAVTALYWDGSSDPLIGWASPPRAGWLAEGAGLPEPLGSAGSVLYQLVPAWGDRAVGVLVKQDAGHVTGVEIKVIGHQGVESTFSIPWPVAGVAAHPGQPLLVWQDGGGAVFGMKLTDGGVVGVP